MKKNLPISLDEILLSFVSNDELRPEMCSPHFEDGKCIATDAHTLIVIPEKYIDNVPEPVDKYPNWKSVIPAFTETPIFKSSLSDLVELKNKIPTVPAYADCKTCNGYGKVHCYHCGKSNDCEDCDGSGESMHVIGEEVNYYEHVIQVGTVRLNPNYAYRLITICEALGTDVIGWHFVDNNRVVAVIEEVMVVTMGCVNVDKANVYVLKTVG